MSQSSQINQWLMQFFLENPNRRITVEELANLAKDAVQSQYSWQQLAEYFVHEITTHHMNMGRLTQYAPAATDTGDDRPYLYGLIYQVTAKGITEFTDLLAAPL